MTNRVRRPAASSARATPLEDDDVAIPRHSEIRPKHLDDEVTEGRSLRHAHELLAIERQKRAELERALRAKDRFIEVLAHDLRSPLNAVRGWTDLLRRGACASERAFDAIERSVRSQAKLIEDLLDVSRIAADRLPLTLAMHDAGELVPRLVSNAQAEAEARGLDLAVMAEVGTFVLVDARRLEQILSNLVANAMKFTLAPGRIDVIVERSGADVCIVVRDTGMGISRELLPRVFDLYTQEGTQGSAGLGLGLYIVRELVERHGGTIDAESRGAKKGATFTMRLPFGKRPRRRAVT